MSCQNSPPRKWVNRITKSVSRMMAVNFSESIPGSPLTFMYRFARLVRNYVNCAVTFLHTGKTVWDGLNVITFGVITFRWITRISLSICGPF